MTAKPPYRVPTMREIAGLPWNGYTVASTFSGGGGSCTGYRMAGFKVAWASEFIPAAQATYKANHPASILDARDVRAVKPQEILDAIGMGPGDLDLFDGSPPCASFSTAGKREKGWGAVKKYSDTTQRTDDLFYEYARLVRGVRPKVFVAENVSGLVKGTAKGYFKAILAELKGCGYRVEARLLDAQWLGVPQARQRLIFVGVRDDLGLAPAFPKPFAYRYSVCDALPWIKAVYTGLDKVCDAEANPSPTILASDEKRTSTTQDKGLGQVVSEADISRFAIGREWDKIKPGQQSDRYFNLVKPALDAPCPTITQTAGNVGAAGVVHPTEKRKFTIAELKRICAFPDDYALLGTYAQQWERLGRSVPPLMMKSIAETVRREILDRVSNRR